MPHKIVDISIPLENDVVSDPPPFSPIIQYLDHTMSLGQMLPFFPGLKAGDLPDSEAWAVEKVELITHNGTHLDAPRQRYLAMRSGRQRDRTRQPSRTRLNAGGDSAVGIGGG